jgi:MSHA biogenesis protein MshO
MNGQNGFTLVEIIMVIVITGILGSMVAVFIRAPVQQYMDAGARAELTDIADLALRRMANELRTAVPSSVLATGTTRIEFLPTKDGGRYRVSGSGVVCASSAASAALSFTESDDCFEILGPEITFSDPATASDVIVVGSMQPGADPYADRGLYNGMAGAQSTVVMVGILFPASAVSQRFEVVPGDQQAVTYACENLGIADGNGTGTLRRYWKYGFTHAYTGGLSAVLANKLYTCNIVVDQGRGLIANTLQFARASEVVSLYHEIHVHSSPIIHVHNTP